MARAPSPACVDHHGPFDFHRKPRPRIAASSFPLGFVFVFVCDVYFRKLGGLKTNLLGREGDSSGLKAPRNDRSIERIGTTEVVPSRFLLKKLLADEI